MILPTTDIELAKSVTYLIDRCMSTREDRDRLYQFREKYYLFGTTGYQAAKYNRLMSHLDLVCSFLYAPDGAFYNIAAGQNEEEELVLRATALQNEFNDDFQDNGITDAIMDALPWSLVYDTMILKQGWNRDRGEWFCELIPPHNFGVYREDIKGLDSQPCFCHSYFIDYQAAVGKMIRAGMASDVSRLAITRSPTISEFPSMLQRMVIAGTGGSNLQGSIFGNINPDYAPVSTYQPASEVPLVRFNELWVWDDASTDFRIIHTLASSSSDASGIIIGDSKKIIGAYKLSDRSKVVPLFNRLDIKGHKPSSETNYFLPGCHPFSVIQPFGKYNYFWGLSHVDNLIPLQDWMLERLDQISDILERQADPARVASGGLGLTEQKMAAFGGAGTYLFDQLPQFKVEEMAPNMPTDIFTEFKEIAAMFLEASGLTELLTGRGEQGVRSRAHASQLKQTGAGRIKKAALSLESPLIKVGDIGLKLKMAHDDDKIKLPEHDDGRKREPFLPCEVGDVKMKIRGHAFSPLFSDETKEFAVMARKLGAIDNEMFVQLMNPPEKANIIHALRARAKMQRSMAMRGLLPQPQGQRSHKRRTG